MALKIAAIDALAALPAGPVQLGDHNETSYSLAHRDLVWHKSYSTIVGKKQPFWMPAWVRRLPQLPGGKEKTADFSDFNDGLIVTVFSDFKYSHPFRFFCVTGY